MKRKSTKNGSFCRLMQLIFKYHKGRFIIAFFCIIISSAGGLISSIFLEYLVDKIITPAMEYGFSVELRDKLTLLLLLVGVGYMITIVAMFLHTRIMNTIAQGVLYRLRVDMFAKMQSLPLKYLDTHAHGEIMSTYINDINACHSLILTALPTIFSCSLICSISLIIMFMYNLGLSLVCLICTLSTVLITKRLGKNSARHMAAQQESIANMEGFIEETLNGQKVVKSFVHEKETKKNFQVFNERLFRDGNKANFFGGLIEPILRACGNFAYVVLALLGSLLILINPNNSSSLTIGILIAFLSLFTQFSISINQLSAQVPTIAMGLVGVSRVFALMDEPPERDEGTVSLVNIKKEENGILVETLGYTGKWAWKSCFQEGKGYDYTELTGDIKFQNVSFGYDSQQKILKDIFLHVQSGQKVAFVGATGAGKTTLANLINRFYEIEEGNIFFDGIDIRRIRKSELRRAIGLILQDVHLFNGSIMDNIRYGRLDATDEECIAAAKLANADRFIGCLPEGYKTVLRNNGTNLSQGQKQLLSIARTAVADVPIMILDEATASIDTTTEKLVTEGLDKLMQNRTVFVIAHRLSTIRNADLIVVMENGRIIECGTHIQLIAQKGKYYRLYAGVIELE